MRKKILNFVCSAAVLAAAFVLCTFAVAQEKTHAPRNYAFLASVYTSIDNEELRKHRDASGMTNTKKVEEILRSASDDRLVRFVNFLSDLAGADSAARLRLFKNAGMADLWIFAYNNFVWKICSATDARGNSQGIDYLFTSMEVEDARVQHELGKAYQSGSGVVKDARESTCWIRKSAEQGYAEAQYTLGKAYSSGRRSHYLGTRLFSPGWDVDKDESEAVRWYRLAAWQGHADAQINLGMSYLRGIGVIADDRGRVYLAVDGQSKWRVPVPTRRTFQAARICNRENRFLKIRNSLCAKRGKAANESNALLQTRRVWNVPAHR